MSRLPLHQIWPNVHCEAINNNNPLQGDWSVTVQPTSKKTKTVSFPFISSLPESYFEAHFVSLNRFCRKFHFSV